MKKDSEVLCSYPNPYLVRNEESAPKVTRSASLKIGLKKKKKEDQKPSGISLGKVSNDLVNSFLNTWQKLIESPQTFPAPEETPVSTFVVNSNSMEEEEQMLSEVLRDCLNLESDSYALNQAMEVTNKIYHEDFPGSYIVEHKGKRLGMFYLNFRSQVNGTSEVNYEFLPKVISFKYLF